MKESETDTWLGRRVRSYEVLSRIGAGGMGEVYRARDTKLGREVALKVLPEEFARDPGRLKRFEQEARSASALNHPNSVGPALLWRGSLRDGHRGNCVQTGNGRGDAGRRHRG